MALTRTERFRLKSGMFFEINQQNTDWELRKLNLLLGEFGLELLDGDWNGLTFEDVIAKVPDAELVEMYSIVTGETPEQVQDAMDSAEPGNWKPGYVRLFVSHSAAHREFVGKMSDELAVVGIDAFVAHNTMERGKPWQAQIEQALKTMDAFVAIVHPEVNNSFWCHQEIGWALGRRVPRFAVRMGANPVGFLGSDQWTSEQFSSHKKVGATVREWLAGTMGLGDKIVTGLFEALENANNYVDAGAAAERVASLGNLNADQWDRLHEAFWANDQLYGGALAAKALKPFFLRNEQPWPPPRPAEAAPTPVAQDPWATPSGEEPPF